VGHEPRHILAECLCLNITPKVTIEVSIGTENWNGGRSSELTSDSRQDSVPTWLSGKGYQHALPCGLLQFSQEHGSWHLSRQTSPKTKVVDFFFFWP
jgi:hypothetical protein